MKKKTVKLLSISNEFSYFICAILFIVGSALADASPVKFQRPTAILFILGSVFYLVGAAAKLIPDISQVRQPKATGTDWLNLWASLFFFSGGLLFTVGAGFFIVNTVRMVITAEVIWDVGSLLFLVGAWVKLRTDQIKLSESYKSSHLATLTEYEQQRYHSQLWLSFQGSDWYYAGTLLFGTGSAVFNVNTNDMTILGNILWILGSVCFMIGAVYKFVSELYKK
jgi:hypothetical protein